MEDQFPVGQGKQLEAFGRKHRTGVVTLLFTDMVGSTALKQQLGDGAAANLFRKHHDLIRETLQQFPQGEEVETAGDSFLLIFATPSDAVQFALLAGSRLRSLHPGPEGAGLDRIGIHVGEVVLGEGGDSPLFKTTRAVVFELRIQPREHGQTVWNEMASLRYKTW
jgi:class 3 adenylate cyclase